MTSLADASTAHRVGTFCRDFPDVVTNMNDLLCTLASVDARVLCHDLDGQFIFGVESTRFHVACTGTGAVKYDLSKVADSCLHTMSTELKLRQVHALFMNDLTQLSFFLKNVPVIDETSPPPTFSQNVLFFKPDEFHARRKMLLHAISARQTCQSSDDLTPQRVCQINDVPLELMNVRLKLLRDLCRPVLERRDKRVFSLEMHGGPYNMLVLVRVVVDHPSDFDSLPDFRKWSARTSTLAQLFVDENNDVLCNDVLSTNAFDAALFCGPAPAPIAWHSCVHDKSVVFSVQPEKVVALANIGCMADIVTLVDLLSHCLRMCPSAVGAAPCSANLVTLHDGRLHLDFCIAGIMQPVSYSASKDVVSLAVPLRMRELYDIILARKRVISQVALRFQANDGVRSAAVFCMQRLFMTKHQAPLRLKSPALKLDWIVSIDWTEYDSAAYADPTPIFHAGRAWSSTSSNLFAALYKQGHPPKLKNEHKNA